LPITCCSEAGEVEHRDEVLGGGRGGTKIGVVRERGSFCWVINQSLSCSGIEALRPMEPAVQQLRMHTAEVYAQCCRCRG
jgi:hypothetical protein